MKILNLLFYVVFLFVMILFYFNVKQLDLNSEKDVYYSTPYGDEFKPIAPVVMESKSFEFNPLHFSASANYGITLDGTFFINSKAFPEADSFILVLLPEKTIHTDKTVRETHAKEHYPMKKFGDYYFARPQKMYSQPLYYFKPDHMYFPTFKKERFAESILLKNDFGGYVIKGNK